jgi:hypothetical protein
MKLLTLAYAAFLMAASVAVTLAIVIALLALLARP